MRPFCARAGAAERGDQDTRERAITRTREILSSHYPAHLDPTRDETYAFLKAFIAAEQSRAAEIFFNILIFPGPSQGR